MFKESVIENKKKKDLEKKRRLNALILRNKFLGEWASTILGFNEDKKLKYIKKVTSEEFKSDENMLITKKIQKDFAKNDIKISSKEIQLKVKDFQIKANIIVENKFKLNNWR